MSGLFVDTGALVAKEIAGDQYHAVAAQRWEEAWRKGFRLVSSQHVFDESATLISRRSTYAFGAQWGLDALGSGIDWLAADEDDWRAALGLMRKFADQGVSFTDCLSVVLMRRSGVKRVFGFDRHFVAMGFRIWPEGGGERGC